jgi:undecaprenyl-diphosphatase
MFGGIDGKVFCLINKTWANPFFDLLMPLVSDLGAGEVLFIVAAGIYLTGRKKGWGKPAILLLSGLAATYYIASFLKTVIGRPRPFVIFTDANLLCGIEKSFSFPSNHAAFAFMAATILSAFFSRWRALLYLLAAAVGFSRIYIGVHYLSDVIGGAVLGMAVGYLLLKISNGNCCKADRQN